jgi:hypothetical protein
MSSAKYVATEPLKDVTWTSAVSGADWQLGYNFDFGVPSCTTVEKGSPKEKDKARAQHGRGSNSTA